MVTFEIIFLCTDLNAVIKNTVLCKSILFVENRFFSCEV